MYGIGQNPVYVARLAEREQKKAKSGETAKEEFDLRAQEAITVLMSDGPEPLLGLDMPAAAPIGAAAGAEAAGAEAAGAEAEDDTPAASAEAEGVAEAGTVADADAEVVVEAEVEEGASDGADADAKASYLEEEEAQEVAGGVRAVDKPREESADTTEAVAEEATAAAQTAADGADSVASDETLDDATSGVVVPVEDPASVGAEPNAEFFDVLYGPPVGLGFGDEEDMPPPLGLS